MGLDSNEKIDWFEIAASVRRESKEIALDYALCIYDPENGDDADKLVHDANVIYNWLTEKEGWKQTEK